MNDMSKYDGGLTPPHEHRKSAHWRAKRWQEAISIDGQPPPDPRIQSPLHQTWVNHKGYPEQLLRLPRSSPGIDANATFG